MASGASVLTRIAVRSSLRWCLTNGGIDRRQAGAGFGEGSMHSGGSRLFVFVTPLLWLGLGVSTAAAQAGREAQCQRLRDAYQLQLQNVERSCRPAAPGMPPEAARMVQCGCLGDRAEALSIQRRFSSQCAQHPSSPGAEATMREHREVCLEAARSCRIGDRLFSCIEFLR